MKRKTILIVTGLISLLMIQTNPKTVEHQQAFETALFQRENIQFVTSYVTKLTDRDSIEQAVNSYFVSNEIRDLASNSIQNLNFGLFSITQLTINETVSSIGIGLFGKVMIWDNLENVKLGSTFSSN